ncbi:MAG TPA: chemotaxis protein CheX [Candidatus Wallbacteria bacterium]|nr:chemotaxis protein CheX [Candidatus Wallbacteria bacterium]
MKNIEVSIIKKEFINPFIEAAATVLPQIVSGISFTRLGLELAKENHASPEKLAVIILGVIGAIRGRVIYILDNKLASQISMNMLKETCVSDELTPLARSALSEMTNMITGKAISILSNAGYNADFSPPTLFIGKEIMIPESDVQAILIPFQTQFGNLELNIALKEKS